MLFKKFLSIVCVFKHELILSLLEGEDLRCLIFVACWQNPSAGCRLENLEFGIIVCVCDECVCVCVCLIDVTIFFPIYVAYVSLPSIFLLSPLCDTFLFSLSKNRLASAMNPVYSPVQPGTPYGNPKNMAFAGKTNQRIHIFHPLISRLFCIVY